jgi:cobalt/nickel transport system permease protein
MVITGVLSAVGLGTALWHVSKKLPPKRVPLLGLGAAFVFAAQMLNFPVGIGVSGHMVGAVLIAALLGPSAAVVVLSAVLVVQCFVFGDGGVTALGANILNMGLICGVGGWLIYYPLSRIIKGAFGRIVAATFAAWCGTVLAAIACAGELATSKATHTSWADAFPIMAGTHMLIGIGEGVITSLVLAATWKARPELLDDSHAARPWRSYKPVLAYGGAIALGLALFVSPFVSKWPDGLDKAAETLGFRDKEEKPENRVVPAVFGDYKIPGIGSVALTTAIAGVAGTILVFGLSWGLARALVPRKPEEHLDAPKQ